MQSLAQAYLTLPGGFGTLEEIFEALTWAQIELHEKPIVFLNIDGYYDYLFKFLDLAVTKGLLEGKTARWLAKRRVGAADDQDGLGRRRGSHAPDDTILPAVEALTVRRIRHAVDRDVWRSRVRRRRPEPISASPGSG